jgi:hypothetical protein
MPFQYTPHQNPYVGSIADLMGRGRDAEAQALITAANAQAQAAQASGQAWGGAIQGIGNTIAAIPGQIQAGQDRELALEDRELLRRQREGSINYTAARTRDLASQDQRRIGNEARAAEQDIRISAVMANPDRTTADFVRIMGAPAGLTFAAGLHKLEDESAELLSPSDRSEHLRGIARAMALLSPALQAEYWPATRARLLADDRLGLTDSDIPEQPNQAFLDGIRNYDAEPTAPVAPGAPWTGTLDGEPTVFERGPDGLMRPIGGGIGPPQSAPSSLTEDERHRAEYAALDAQGLIPEGVTFPRWLANEKKVPEAVEPDVALTTDESGYVDVPASLSAFGVYSVPEEDKLWNRADKYTTGVLSIPTRVFGALTGLGEESQGNMLAIDMVRHIVARALAENPRLADRERVAIEKSINLNTGAWISPDTVGVSILELDTLLRRTLDRRYRGNIDDIGAILQAIDVLGAPTVQTPPVTFQFDNEGILIQE